MTEPWTVRRVVAWIQSDLAARKVSSPRLDADLLVAQALGQQRITLYTDPDRPLMAHELAVVRGLVARRRAGEPMAYICGTREFYGRTFEVTPDVLIPRPDTETLVEEALGCARDEDIPGALLDLCTGSGAVGLTLAAERPARSIVASDISEAALGVAARNAQRLGVAERVRFRRGDLFEVAGPDERFACITVNPPYIGSDELRELAPDVRDFEPRLALDAGPDALSFYRRLAAQASPHLVPGGALLVEVGHTQARDVMALFRDAGFQEVRAVHDLSGIQRVVRGRQPG